LLPYHHISFTVKCTLTLCNLFKVVC